MQRKSKCKYFIWEDVHFEELRDDLEPNIPAEPPFVSRNEAQYDVGIGEWKNKVDKVVVLFDKLIFLVGLNVFLLFCVFIVLIYVSFKL